VGKRRPRAGAECGDSEAIWADPGLSGPLHVTPLRRSIPRITVSSSDTDQLDLPPADETVATRSGSPAVCMPRRSIPRQAYWI